MVTAAGGLGWSCWTSHRRGDHDDRDELPLNELLQKAGDSDFLHVLWRKASCNC